VSPDFSLAEDFDLPAAKALDRAFSDWCDHNLSAHKDPRHVSVTISLKKHGNTPGDATASQMRAMASIAKKYAYDELRVSHEQNIIFPHVAKANLAFVFNELAQADLASDNIGLVSDIIACTGLDYCGLATARSIPIAKQIAMHFKMAQKERELGHIKIKISGCINACGHHHVGHIGILGLKNLARNLTKSPWGVRVTKMLQLASALDRGLVQTKY